MRRVTGIGGVFFKCKDPDAIKQWYAAHLGLDTDKYGTCFAWYQGADNTKKGFTQWSPFTEQTTYFAPSKKELQLSTTSKLSSMESLCIFSTRKATKLNSGSQMMKCMTRLSVEGPVDVKGVNKN